MGTANVENEVDEISLSPDRLLQIGMGFWPAKVLLTAVKMGLFTVLSRGGMSSVEIQLMWKLNGRGLVDFLDSLVSLGALDRNLGIYRNSAESDLFLVRTSPHYVGGMLEMANNRLYEFWGKLEEALVSGRPQNETKIGGNILDVIYSDSEKTRIFQEAMIGLSLNSSEALVNHFDFGQHRSFCDVGGGPGCLSVAAALRYPSLKVVNFDFPQTEIIFNTYLAQKQMLGRVDFVGGNCLTDNLPPADIYALGHVLHGWGNAEETHIVLKKIYEALPIGGALLVVEALIDDDRHQNLFGLLMSLDMLIETSRGRNFTASELVHWVQAAGFTEARVSPLTGPISYLSAYKR